MQFSTVTLLSALAAAASAATHSIDVGLGGLVFSPNNLTAAVGDTVVFSFHPMKHSVAQASFGKPCVPLNDTSFFSGAIATSSGVNDQTYTITVENTTPIWFYCSVGAHCASGMVGSINAKTTGNTITAYIAAAKNTTTTTAPATVQGGVLSGSSGSSTPSTTNTTSSTNSSSSSNSTTSKTNAGIETRGAPQWTMMAFTGLMAITFGGLLL